MATAVEALWLKDEVFKAQTQLLDLIASEHSFDRLLQSLIFLVEQFALEMRCCILIADLAAKVLRVRAAPHLPAAFVSAIDGTSVREREGSCGTAAFRREVVIVSDIAASALWETQREATRAAGLASCWSVPLFDNTKELICTVAMYYTEKRVPKGPEFELLRIAGSLASMVIKRFRDSKNLQTSELRYRELANKCPDPIIAHVNGRLLFANQAACTLLQIEAIGLAPEVYLDRYFPQHLRNALLSHATGLLSTQLHVANTVLRVEITATPLTMDHELATLFVVRDVSRRVAIESALFEAETRLQEHLTFDLHDGVGQQLTGVFFDASSIECRNNCLSPGTYL